MNFIFDLDGVLVDFKKIHRDAFLIAWNSTYPEKCIDNEFHSENLEARSTMQKLEVLSKFFNFDFDAKSISYIKQEITCKLLETSTVYSSTRNALKWAIENNISVSCCSNSIRKTVETSLAKLADLSIFKTILSNEDVVNPKPSPDIYKKAIELLGCSPNDIIVFEDSLVGKTAGRAAGLNVIEIVDALDITPNFLRDIYIHKRRMEPKQINVVIPMAGLGSRFKKEGYEIPKPFLPVFGKPMFKRVIENIVPDSLLERAIIHIVARRDQVDMFESLKDNDAIHLHIVEKLTEGAACTVLTLKEKINSDFPLVIANSDQYLEWSSNDFYRCLFHPDFDGVISTFEQPSPLDLRWSYAQINAGGRVTKVAEKEYISPFATTGIYGWKHGSDFVLDCESMISRNIRVNNEFYVCPVYNLGIERGLNIRTHNCIKMWGLGVPKDYEYFLANYKFNESK